MCINTEKHQITKLGIFLDLGDDLFFSLWESRGLVRTWIDVMEDLSFFNCQMFVWGAESGGGGGRKWNTRGGREGMARNEGDKSLWNHLVEIVNTTFCNHNITFRIFFLILPRWYSKMRKKKGWRGEEAGLGGGGLEESGIGIGRGQNWKGRREVKPGLKPLVLTALLGQLPHLNTFASAFMTCNVTGLDEFTLSNYIPHNCHWRHWRRQCKFFWPV